MNPRCALLVITDGRADCLKRTLASAEENLEGTFGFRLMVNDAAESAYSAWLDATYPQFERIHHPQRRGFCGAIQSGWERLRRERLNWIVHLEDDFEILDRVNLQSLIAVMAGHPYLAQLVLKRQPWNEQERAAGDILALWPQEFAQRSTPHGQWLEHRLWFSTNPSIYRPSLLLTDWPDPPRCEEAFTQQLLQQGFSKIAPADVRFGVWGRRDDPPRVWHLGDQRVGAGY
jgi:hypothetical protein